MPSSPLGLRTKYYTLDILRILLTQIIVSKEINKYILNHYEKNINRIVCNTDNK